MGGEERICLGRKMGKQTQAWGNAEKMKSKGRGIKG